MALKSEAGQSVPTAGRRVKEYAASHVGFAWLRMFGALFVVVDHSKALISPQDPSMFPGNWHVGDIMLLGFFAMSGFQIHASWEGDPSWYRFAGRRLLRIVPPMATVLVFTSLLIGPIFTTLSTSDYFARGQVWGYLTGAVPFVVHHQLPGVFEHNPSAYSINPSMWTLPMEMVGYTLIAVLGLIIAFGASRLVTFLVIGGLLVQQGVFLATVGEYGAGGFLFETPINFLVKDLVAFAIGMALHMFRDKIKFSVRALWVLFAAWLVVNFFVAPPSVEAAPGWAIDPGMSVPLVLVNQYLMAFLAAYGAVTIAHHWPKRLEGGAKWVFGSYGTYIWAGVTQQTLIALGVHNTFALLAIALPVSYGLGLLSWNFIEAPTQKLRRHLRAKDLRIPDKRTAEPAPAGTVKGTQATTA